MTLQASRRGKIERSNAVYQLLIGGSIVRVCGSNFDKKESKRKKKRYPGKLRDQG